MDWNDLLRSVVLAATISGVVAAIGFCVSAATALQINKDKIGLDKELAAQTSAAELVLAERRVEFERISALARRRAEVAEEVLAGFYRIRKAFEAIRSPLIWAGEMVAEEGVAEDVVQNDGYGVIRRIRAYADQFSKLEATRFTFGALFGQTSTAPYDAITKAHNQVFHAAEDLLRYRHQQDLPQLTDHIRHMRSVAFATTGADAEGNVTPNKLSEEIDEAVAEIEATCRGALETGPTVDVIASPVG